MALSDILQAKSPEEQQNLKDRGFVQTGVGGKWKFKMSIAPILEMYEEDEDTDEFKNSLIELLDEKMEDVEAYLNMSNNQEDTEYEMMQYESVLDELQMLDEYPEESEIDYVLNMLYDFADDNNIWVDSME